MKDDTLKPLYSISITLDTIEFQRNSYNNLMRTGNNMEAVQQLKAIQSQLQSIMTAYNSTLDNLNEAVNMPPDFLEPFNGGI